MNSQDAFQQETRILTQIQQQSVLNLQLLWASDWLLIHSKSSWGSWVWLYVESLNKLTENTCNIINRYDMNEIQNGESTSRCPSLCSSSSCRYISQPGQFKPMGEKPSAWLKAKFENIIVCNLGELTLQRQIYKHIRGIRVIFYGMKLVLTLILRLL